MNRVWNAITSTFAAVMSATRVVAAFEARRTPSASDLRRLGINPAAFARIRHA